MQEMDLQEKIWHIPFEQEVYWAQKAHKNWMQLGKKNKKIFQFAATRKHGKILFEKYGMIWKLVEDQNDILQVITSEFCRRLKKN